MRRVVLPQAFKIALPPYGNNLIMLLKDSSQTSAITVAELALESKLIASSTFKNLTVFTMGAVGYLLMSIPLIMLVSSSRSNWGNANDLNSGHSQVFWDNEVLDGISLEVARAK